MKTTIGSRITKTPLIIGRGRTVASKRSIDFSEEPETDMRTKTALPISPRLEPISSV